jgi:EAL domain-containing protein (putative c-di-GMP-specific phosphodiesterase class I)
LFITSSIGVLMITEEHLKTSQVLRDADIAMYRAKSLGKDRHEIFQTSITQRAAERQEIETILRDAQARGELQIQFQPIYAFPNRQIVGLEALLRLNPIGRQSIPPAVFIPIAEEINMINEIGDWVLLESCKKMHEWHQRYPAESHLNLHINISLKQLVSNKFMPKVLEVLKTTQLDPTKLRFEITENTFAENIQYITLVLDQLSLLGIQILIDDFGAGCSSLGYIRRFPINTIKLDRKFIFREKADGNEMEVVKAILAMANELGLTIVAEGIETEEQAESLIDMKCHFGQGFLFSRPMEIKALEYIFNQKNTRG